MVRGSRARSRALSAPEVSSLFQATFSSNPDAIWSAPARVNLIGEHTDYNGGEVLPIAIQMRTSVSARAASGDIVRVVSANAPGVGEFSATSPVPTNSWWDYVAGVVAEFRALGNDLPGLEIAVASDIPHGAGLASSAALEVAAAFAIGAACEVALQRRGAALLAHQAETGFVGVQCGIMDQFVAALAREGNAVHLWCDEVKVRHVPFTDSVLIFDTSEPRALRVSRFNERRAECNEALRLLRVHHPALTALAGVTQEMIHYARLPDLLHRRAMHVATETQRVSEAATALAAGRVLPGDLLYASHESLRLNYDCSTPALNWFVERARENPSIRGARLTGAGWGGCALAVGESGALAQWSLQVRDEFWRAFGREGRAWMTNAAEGARDELHKKLMADS